MSSGRFLTVLAIAGATAAIPATASAKWYGSTLQGPANATYGCEAAMVADGLGSIVLTPTNQTSCTYRHGGYLFNLGRPTFLVPASGRIKRIRVKSGPNPAKLRLTILSGSSRVDTFSGQDLPGTYTCCTARYIGKAFRPRPNAITTKRVNAKVSNVRSKDINIRIHSSDGVALTAVGPGTVSLSIGPDLGSFNSGTPTAIGYWPFTGRGEPRVDGYSMTGIDVLFQWDFRRR
jgi:hypothetical protein